jgi:hypothetical protein
MLLSALGCSVGLAPKRGQDWFAAGEGGQQDAQAAAQIDRW